MSVGFAAYLLRKLADRNTAKADCVAYPFFTDPKEPCVSLDEVQADGVARLRKKLRSGLYQRVKNPCLCGNDREEGDILVARHDMHGLPLDVLLCGKCGLLRAAEVFDPTANESYYRFDYRDIHNGGTASAGSYFVAQLERGESFLRVAAESAVLDDVATVLEIGCGSGGILYPFHLAGKRVAGLDYDDNYIAYGRSRGLDLYCVGKDDGMAPAGPFDLLILSHVVEHFLRPHEELTSLIGRVADGKYLLIEVPGLFAESTKQVLYGYPVRYFQVAHVIQFFYRDFLALWYAALGLEVIYGDETATFLLRKPVGWTPKEAGGVYAPELARYPDLVGRYLRETYFDYRYRPDLQKVKNLVAGMLDSIGVKNKVKRYLKKWRMM